MLNIFHVDAWGLPTLGTLLNFVKNEFECYLQMRSVSDCMKKISEMFKAAYRDDLNEKTTECLLRFVTQIFEHHRWESLSKIGEISPSIKNPDLQYFVEALLTYGKVKLKNASMKDFQIKSSKIKDEELLDFLNRMVISDPPYDRGIIYSKRGDLDLALIYFENFQEIYSKIGYKQEKSSLLGNIELVYSKRGDLNSALEHHYKALRIHRKMGAREREAEDLKNIGLILNIMGRKEKALKILNRVLDIFGSIGADKQADTVSDLILQMVLENVPERHELTEFFLELSRSIKVGDPTFRLLPKLGEEIKKHAEGEDKARISRNLGIIYLKISLHRDKAENCKRAIRSYKEALKTYTLEDSPMNYARIHLNIGLAYKTLAEVENMAENCIKAVEACEEALKVCTFEDSPVCYAGAQLNLGAAYFTLAKIEDRAENCKKGIEACEEALRAYTPEDFPEDYAMTQNNLGSAYLLLAESKGTVEYCKKAIKAYEEALRIHTVRDHPMYYPMAQANLGSAYVKLAKIENKAENCRKAIEIYKKALKVYTLEDFPIQYAVAQVNLESAYSKLTEIEKL